jgi:hypothetical protein
LPGGSGRTGRIHHPIAHNAQAVRAIEELHIGDRSAALARAGDQLNVGRRREDNAVGRRGKVHGKDAPGLHRDDQLD